jgi:hypothetical protein
LLCCILVRGELISCLFWQLKAVITVAGDKKPAKQTRSSREQDKGDDMSETKFQSSMVRLGLLTRCELTGRH